MRRPRPQTPLSRAAAIVARACLHVRAIRRGLGAGFTAAVLLLGAPGDPTASAQELSPQQMQGLDEQVQEIKSEVLGIAADLSLLEERLLYPSDTQVSVFVSLDGGEGLRLDSVQLQIDGAPVARHIYSFKELEALQKGGVQRIYTGNLPTGEHQLEVSVAGKLPGGGDFGRTERFGFRKEVGPSLLGVTVAQGGALEIGSF